MPTPRTPRSVVLAAVAAGAVAVPAAALAATGIGHVTGASVRLTAHHPGRSAGLRVVVRGRLPRPGVTEAPAVRQVIVLPRGARIDTRGAVRCHATVAQLERAGAEGACPKASRIGTGSARGVRDGAAVSFDIGIYAFPHALSFAAEQHGMPLKQGFFGRVRGARRLVLDVPTFGGTIAPRRFEADIRAHTRGRHHLFTTPARCPRRGWRFVAVSEGLSGVGGRVITPAQRVVAHERCRG